MEPLEISRQKIVLGLNHFIFSIHGDYRDEEYIINPKYVEDGIQTHLDVYCDGCWNFYSNRNPKNFHALIIVTDSCFGQHLEEFVKDNQYKLYLSTSKSPHYLIDVNNAGIK